MSTYPEGDTIAWHQLTALSWRVMSELARADPELYIAAITDDGMGNSPQTFVFMMRRGKVWFQARRGGGGFFVDEVGKMILWEHAFALRSAREVAAHMMRLQGGGSPVVLPATRPRALGYRVMASMLELTLGDKEPWTVQWDQGGGGYETRGRHPYEDSAFSLIRDGRVVASFDNFGWMRRPNEEEGSAVELMPLYVAHGRRILPLVAEIFGADVK
ncbi:hypothetical protein [Sinomonas flava]|uniref:T3SS peptide-binding chaperone domain-containing protein n=1 Tax=Sinomonas flava TaxID=496857 RepID=A0ABP5NK49_9MICC